MEAEFPLWAQSIATIVLTIGAAASMQWHERRKALKEHPHGTPDGNAQVVAASFVERQTLSDLTTTIRNLDSTMHLLIPLVARNNDLLHDQAQIERLRGHRD